MFYNESLRRYVKSCQSKKLPAPRLGSNIAISPLFPSFSVFNVARVVSSSRSAVCNVNVCAAQQLLSNPLANTISLLESRGYCKYRWETNKVCGKINSTQESSKLLHKSTKWKSVNAINNRSKIYYSFSLTSNKIRDQIISQMEDFNFTNKLQLAPNQYGTPDVVRMVHDECVKT